MNIFCPIPSCKGLSNDKPSKCQRHLAKMCDIRTMIARALSGDVSVYSRASYADVSKAPDSMQEILNSVCRGREAYESLPNAVKAVYPSPEVFMSALSNPSEKERLITLGVFEKVPSAEPVTVRVINADGVDKGTNPEAHANT